MAMESGIPGLDKLYEFKKKQIILTYGPPGPEKSVLAQQFIFEGLKKGEPAIYITTDHSPQEVRELMLARGWDITPYEQSGQFRFIDCYSWTIHEKDRSPSVTTSPSPSALSEMAIAISMLEQKLKGARVIFDSLSTILLYNEETSVFKFMQVMASKTKHFEAFMMVLLEDGMHPESVRVTLEHLTDGSLIMKTVPDHQLKLERITTSDWVSYKITDEGVVVLA
jgi:KaiC/GvpD/RAD55 family RecA-like ATPase